jgi:hypothetical protein
MVIDANRRYEAASRDAQLGTERLPNTAAVDRLSAER